MINVELDDAAAQQALRKLAEAGTNLLPLMQDIGEFLTETTKQRFETSKGPDGSPWESNSETTLLRHLARYKGSYTKTGKLSAGGTRRLSGKKPLIGESRALSTTIHYQASANHVDVGSAMIYAGVQQFGAAARSFAGGLAPWGDIPARPFLGISSEDATQIIALAQAHLDISI